ncbi:hyalin-like [Amphiura filiformis]|uniref:hyalin-like n=1 Tax=Amphiura filiformis TaxID=82378 RepID=UPI003B2225A3
MGVCISNDMLCDNIAHCYNGEDEIDCECKNSEYKCDIGICIPKLKVCDGKIDCSLGSKNNSDERHSLCDHVELQRTGWKCGLTIVYIPKLFLCDGYKDCPGGEDEDSDTCVVKGSDTCKEGEFSCEASSLNINGNHVVECFPKSALCDGVINCYNMSDESNLYCAVDIIPPRITNRGEFFSFVDVEFVDGTEPRGARAKWEDIIAIDNFGDELRFETDIYLLETWPYSNSNLSKGDFFPEGQYLVLEIVTDEARNYYNGFFVLSVRAVQEIITIMGCPDDITKEIGSNVNDVEVSWNPPTAVITTISGSTSLAPTVPPIYMPGHRFSPGVTSIDYEFRYDKICSFNVTVLVADTDPPEIFGCNISIDLIMPEYEDAMFFPDGAYIYNWSRPYAEERPNKSHEVSLVTETRQGVDPLFFPGRTTVNYVFRDQNGNTAECNFTVTVPDDRPPRVKCPGNINQSVPVGIKGRFIIWQEPIVSDYSFRSGEKVMLVSQSHTSGEFFPLGCTGVTYKYSDWVDNTAVCKFDVRLFQSRG